MDVDCLCDNNGKNIHRAWVSRVRKAGMIVRSVDNGRTMKK